MLKIKNLSKYFGGIKAVDNCSFEIQKGKITALIGPNGSGKSTLFNLVAGVLKLDKGNIFLDGEDITNISISKRVNRGISRIFQKSRLFGNLTIKENMFLALETEDTKFWKSFFSRNKIHKEKEINEALSLVKMDIHMNQLARNLSYGQKRLVEVVRSILMPHKILMLDEPLAGVAPALRKELSDLFLKLKEKKETIFIIEHDMNFVLNIADEVVVMDEGKVIAQGKPVIIKKNKKVLQAYFGE